MKVRIQAGREVVLILLLLAAVGSGARAQWQIGEEVLAPPWFGYYFSMRLGTDAPPLPFLPREVPVYFLGTMPGTTNLAFAYDDRGSGSGARSSMQSTENEPPVPGEGSGGDSSGGTNSPPPSWGYDYGAGLYLLIGPTNIVSGAGTNREAWLILTNTHNPKFYQLEGRPQVVGAPWELGEIGQDTGSSNQVRLSNVPVVDPVQRFFRGVEADTVAFIGLDPDYSLAVELGSTNGAAQTGKFRVSLSPLVSSNVTVYYQVSGSASNGQDYSSLGGSVSVPASPGWATIEIQPLHDTLPEFDESVTLTLVRTNGYLVHPNYARATMKIYDPRPTEMAVAIHDSGWTRWFGLSSTNWNYFVLPESVKEALRSDGTPYAVVSDLDIASGFLLTTNSTPRYPILISLGAEVIREDEIAALTNYVAAGGFLLVGSSSFTRYTNGNPRSNFALSSHMGLSCSPSTDNWADNSNFYRVSAHRLASHIPSGGVVWRMPTSADEISWGSCLDNHSYNAPHQLWQVATNPGVQVLAWGDSFPYLAVNQYGSGCFIYHAALQPLLGHGGFAPGMCAYMVFRRAIEWAFESAQRPVAKLSPWPYQYDAAFMVRHDLENFWDEVQDVAASAYIEYTNGAKGDYYFCTGAITNRWNYGDIVAGLQQAVSYGATIGPHNGGLPNLRATADTNSSCHAVSGDDYIYFHWGPDEALDLAGGREYASNSLAISFAQIEGWLTNYQAANPRVWVAPYFNGTREDSYEMQEELDIRITGDQKLTPFPAWTLSTRTDGKRYGLLSEPTSDWFVNGYVAQSLDPWHEGVHTSQTMHEGVDFYYANGFLINFYAHGLATGYREYPYTAGYLIPDYIQYGMSTSRFPKLWSSNARGIYAWWLNRSNARISASYSTNGTHSVAGIVITGSQDTNMAVEIFASGFGSAVVSELLTNGVAANSAHYRTSGELIKVRVGTTVTNVQLEYFAGPIARDDFYLTSQTQTLTKAASTGVLSNDWSGTWPGLVAITNSIPVHGTLQWNTTHDGGFTYVPATNGTECFGYQASDGTYSFGNATVTLLVIEAGALYSDDFTRCSANILYPWQVHSGGWTMAAGVMQGSQSGNYAYSCLSPTWTNYSVEAEVQFATGTYGGGLGGRLNPSTGAHYAAWLYPDDNVIYLVKFSTWDTWGYNGSSFAPMAQTNVTIGSGLHPLKLVCTTNNLVEVYYHGTNVISKTDTDTASPPHSTGAVSLDVYDGTISARGLLVSPIP